MAPFPPQGPLPRRAGTPWWVWLIICVLVLIVGSFAGCGACVYLFATTPSAPECNETKDACHACCTKEKMSGGRLESRRTRINGANYRVCVCD